MPNGGSDCCATCWFNRKNRGEAGYDHVGAPEPAYCEIREFDIPDPPSALRQCDVLHRRSFRDCQFTQGWRARESAFMLDA